MSKLFEHKKIARNYSKITANNLNVFPWSLKYIQDGIKILDVGCGQGNTLEFLNNKFKNLILYGIDPSKEMIKLSKMNKNLIQISSEKMDLHEKNFNIILSRFSFKWFKNKKLSLKNIYSHLDKKGIFLLWDSGELEYQEIIHHIINILKKEKYDISKVERYFSKYRIPTNKIEIYLKNAGFLIIDQKEIIIPESFISSKDFVNNWLIPFGILDKISKILNEDQKLIFDIITNNLSKYYPKEMTLDHHNYGFVCRRKE